MFEQVVGEGANLFLIVIAIIIGFIAGLSYVDFQKVKREEQNQNDDHS